MGNAHQFMTCAALRMASAVTIDAFWTALEQSELLSAEQLESVRDAIEEAKVAPPADIAGRLVQKGWLSRFQADRLLEGRSRGFFFDHYKVVDLLGVGGMGWVYHAVDTKTKEVVALKVLRDDLKHDRGMLARFHQEARVGLQLDHPNIVRTRAFGSAGGLPYVIMEYVQGINLLELLADRQRLPWPQACDFARQAALGLEYAHRRGIVHRDIKPQNLLINPAGEVRLLDFGLSMVQEGESGDEFSLAMIFGHESVGTTEFAAPEQVKDSLAADARSDIFSLGATLFASLTGVNPFPTANQEANYKVCLRSVREFVPSIPADLAEAVARMLELDPQKRYSTAGEVAEALAPWAKPGPVDFDFAAALRERKRFARKRLAQISSTAAGALGLARSTARPASVSSVAQSNDPRPAMLPNDDPTTVFATLHPLPATTVRGPAARWAQDTALAPPLGASLILVNGNLRIPLIQERVVVGRGDDCDLRLMDGAVSSRHCEFRFDGRRWWIVDLNSRNGTTVNGKAAKKRALHCGDEIVIGNLQRFRWECDGKGGPSATSPRSKALLLMVITILVLTAAVITAAALLR